MEGGVRGRPGAAHRGGAARGTTKNSRRDRLIVEAHQAPAATHVIPGVLVIRVNHVAAMRVAAARAHAGEKIGADLAVPVGDVGPDRTRGAPHGEEMLTPMTGAPGAAGGDRASGAASAEMLPPSAEAPTATAAKTGLAPAVAGTHPNGRAHVGGAHPEGKIPVRPRHGAADCGAMLTTGRRCTVGEVGDRAERARIAATGSLPVEVAYGGIRTTCPPCEGDQARKAMPVACDEMNVAAARWRRATATGAIAGVMIPGARWIILVRRDHAAKASPSRCS